MVNLDIKSTINDLNGSMNKVDSATSDRFPSCSAVAQLKGQSVKGQSHFGSYKRLLCYFYVQLRHVPINEHATMGLPHTEIFNSVAFNSIK